MLRQVAPSQLGAPARSGVAVDASAPNDTLAGPVIATPSCRRWPSSSQRVGTTWHCAHATPRSAWTACAWLVGPAPWHVVHAVGPWRWQLRHDTWALPPSNSLP